MLGDAKAVADPLGTEQDHVVKIGVGIATVVVCLSGMEDKWEVDPKRGYFSPHGDKLGYPVLVRVARILLSVHVEPCIPSVLGK